MCLGFLDVNGGLLSTTEPGDNHQRKRFTVPIIRLRSVKQGKDRTYFEVTIPVKAMETLKWNDGDALITTMDKEKDQLTYKRAKLN